MKLKDLFYFIEYKNPCRLVAIFFLACISSPALTEELSLSHLPLTVRISSSPNLAFTFDDSTSMSTGYMPNKIGDFSKYKAAKSIKFNLLTYNPDINYKPGLDVAGNELPQANFSAAVLGIKGKNKAREPIDIYKVYAEKLNPSDFSVDLNINYRHPWLLLSNSDEQQYALDVDDKIIAGQNLGQAAYYYIWNESLPFCDKEILNDACYEKKFVSEKEKQNFANWYQYHSIRILVGKTSISRSFNNLPPNLRVARQTINHQGFKSGDNNPFIAAFNGANKEKLFFYDWLYAISPAGDTPLRGAMITAGEFFSQNQSDNTYERVPGGDDDGDDAIISCRRNYHLIFTDGYYSEEASGKLQTIGDYDQRAISANDWPGPIEFAYDPLAQELAIFRGSGSSTLADVAFYYWARDLVPGDEFENNLTPVIKTTFSDFEELKFHEYWNPENNPATWQHMVNLIIGFGISGHFNADDDNDYQSLLKGDFDWFSPVPVVENRIENMKARVDDLWHAAIVSRGKYYNVENPLDFEKVLNNLFGDISQSSTSVAPVSVSSKSFASSPTLYQAGFETQHWTGFLKKFQISDGSATESEGDSCNSKPMGTLCETGIEVNNASVSEWNQRKVFSYNPQKGSGKKGINLSGGSGINWPQLNEQQRIDLGVRQSDIIARQRLDFILGDKSQEVAEKKGGGFRNRIDKQRNLGAIIHAGPQYVGNGRQNNGSYTRFYPDYISPPGSSYSDFLMEINDRSAMVYVGSADGQLHAYKADNLKEMFSYIPDAIFPFLKDYTEKDFNFFPYVDGPLKEADVFINSRWYSLLVGSFRSSAKGLFALDITHPEKFDEDNVKWEYSMRSFPNDHDIGHIYSEVSLVKTAKGSRVENPASGDWLIVSGNGYNSKNGRAVLYFLDPETGEVLVKIDTGVGPESSKDESGHEIDPPFNVIKDLPNGLGAPTVIDIEGDYRADFAYAGDLYGNLWRFDLRDSRVENWSVKLVFSAKDKKGLPQHIMAVPVVGQHPDGHPGLMVYFGTGKFLESSDNDVLEGGVQSLYGIWDRVDINLSIDADGDGKPDNDDYHIGRGLGRKHLLQQKILQQSAFKGGDNIEVRVVTNYKIQYFTGQGFPDTDNTFLGWVLDLDKEAGERITAQAILRGGRIIFTTLLPDANACKSAGESWLMELNARSGGSPAGQALDNNGDGLINSADYHEGSYTAGWKKADLGVYTIPAILHDRKSGLDYKIMSTGSGNITAVAESSPNGDTGRQAWRKLR